MLKALVNEARLRLEIKTEGPLLIKTGYATVIGADMSPVITYRHGKKEVYIPGSSLKGIFRSHIEKVANSIHPQVACNPLSRPGDQKTENQGKNGEQLYRISCGSRLDDKQPSHEVYARSCPTCRLFGSTAFSSRIAIGDAYLSEENTGLETEIERRDGIAIDRLTGGVSGNAKFDMDVVAYGQIFLSDIHLRNFEIWQLGMLFVIIQDLEDQLIRIGSGRSRGQGKIKASIYNKPDKLHPGGVVLSTIRRSTASEPDNELWGLGHWLNEQAAIYGAEKNDLLRLEVPVTHEKHGVRNNRVFKGKALKSLKEQCIEAFIARMQEWSFPTEEGASAQRSQR